MSKKICANCGKEIKNPTSYETVKYKNIKGKEITRCVCFYCQAEGADKYDK